MKVRRRGIGIIQLLSIPPINLDLKLDRGRGMQVMMKEDILIVVERDDRNTIERTHRLGEIGNRNIEPKLTQMNTTMKTIIIIGRNHINTTDHDHIPISPLHFHFEDIRPHRVFRYLIKCLILVIYLYQEWTRDQGLDRCNMLLRQVHSLDIEEGGSLRQAVGEVGTHHLDLWLVMEVEVVGWLLLPCREVWVWEEWVGWLEEWMEEWDMTMVEVLPEAQ